MTTHITINGRTQFADTATTSISVREYSGGPEVLVIHGGSVHQRDTGEFQLTAKHPTATDEERDASYVAYFEGSGLRLDHMYPRGLALSGALFSAKYWNDPQAQVEGLCTTCPEQHGYLDFVPPEQPWRPGHYILEVRFHSPAAS